MFWVAKVSVTISLIEPGRVYMTTFPTMAKTSNNPRDKHEYDSRLFVGREEELARVARDVQTIKNQSMLVNPIVNFWGVAGIGKTWLLKHLEEKYRFPCRELVSFTTYHTFEDDIGDPLPSLAQSTTKAIKTQLESLLNESESRELEEVAAQTDPRILVDLIRSLANRIVPFLLLDNTESLDQDNWSSVERKIIEPLAQHGRIIIVVAGRRSSNWYRFEARRRAQTARIKEFNQEQIQELLKRYGVELDTSLVLPFTAGTPGLVRDIAEFARGVGTGSVLETEWVARLKPHLVKALNRFEEHFLQNLEPQLQPILRALIPLRVYRLDAFSKMTAGVARLPGAGNDLTLLRELATTEVAWWDSAHRAYITDPIGRRVLDRKLLLEDPAAYRAKHGQALKIYQASAEEFKFNSEDFILESWFHLASLYSVTHDEDLLLRGYAMYDQDKTHVRGIEEWLDFAKSYLKPDGLVTLNQQFSSEHDPELFDLIPQHLRDKITERLSHLT